MNADGVLDRLIVEWNNVKGATTSPSAVTFQAILELNTGTAPGAIIFNYVDLIAGNFRNNGGSATVASRRAARRAATASSCRGTTARTPTSAATYPLITPIGRILATLCDSPAWCTTSTTSSTFL